MLDNYTPNQFRMLCLLTHYRNRKHCVRRLVLVSQSFVFPGFVVAVFLLLLFLVLVRLVFVLFLLVLLLFFMRCQGWGWLSWYWKARHNTDVGSSPWCSKGFPPPPPPPESTSSADSLTVFLQTLCVKSDASTSVRTFKIPNSHTNVTVWTHENTAHPGRNGSRCFCGCCALPKYGDPNFLWGTTKRY